MKKTEFEQLQKEFLQLGGSEKVLAQIGNSLSLRNEARIKYEIKKLEKKARKTPTTTAHTPAPASTVAYQPRATFQDYISEYPPELHPTYLQRQHCFLQACSLKVQLNALADAEVLQASKLQWEIWHQFAQIDKCDKTLQHYQHTRRIMPTEVQEDFSKIPDKRLHQKLHNLRSNRGYRQRTIEQLRKDLPPIDHP
ncbi:MAG: hypothetical protein Q4F57_05965, partial [Weeksellaceae bacterium]|nr:hypothetical protein [Weeksellaceae bacterium]